MLILSFLAINQMIYIYLHPLKDSQFSGCSVARLSRRVWDAEVAGSNPATPTKLKPSLLPNNEGFFHYNILSKVSYYHDLAIYSFTIASTYSSFRFIIFLFLVQIPNS